MAATGAASSGRHPPGGVGYDPRADRAGDGRRPDARPRRPRASAPTCSPGCPASWFPPRSSRSTSTLPRTPAGPHPYRGAALRPRPSRSRYDHRSRPECRTCGPGCSRPEQVGLDDDFFALGGNSLLAAEMLARARVMFGIGAELRPSAHPLPAARPDAAGFLERPPRTPARDGSPPTATDAASRLRRARPRLADPDPAGRRGPSRRGRTGSDRATYSSPGRPASSGLHLLRELLAATTARVHCLVRARQGARTRGRRIRPRPPNATGLTA